MATLMYFFRGCGCAVFNRMAPWECIVSDLKIIVTSGGKNLELGRRVQSAASGIGKSSKIIQLDNYELPIYTRANKDDNPKGLRALIDDLEGPSPWMMLLPEYNGGLPPVWINALTWISVDYADFRSLFNRRKIAIGTASGGHGWKALAAMREQFAHLGSDVVGRYIRDAKGSPASEESIMDALSRLDL